MRRNPFRGWIVRAVSRALVYTPIPGIIVTTIIALFGVDLITQSDRFHNTPAYKLLLGIFTTDTWGAIHLAAAIGMATTLLWRRRELAIGAHTFALVLLATWEFAFIVRWVTDGSTTGINPLNWMTLIGLALWSALLIDRRPLP